jgi:hypothetical protein
MSKICDRSPCDEFLEGLGNYIFGSQEGWYMVVTEGGKDKEVSMRYCLSCGTHLEGLPQAILERYMRPRRRRRKLIAMS